MSPARGHAGHDHHAHNDRVPHGAHRHGGADAHVLGGAFWVTLAILAVEIAGGALAHSLALLSDAGHMLTDVLALALAWYATRLAGRPPTARHTYGYHRAGILAALFNAGTLIVVAGGILAGAAARFLHPVAVTPWLMCAVAALALCGNLLIGMRLARGAGAGLNLRGVRLHVLGDAAASAGVIAAGLLTALTHRQWWDPLISVGIALLIARGAWAIVVQTVNVLMEGAPPGIDPAEVEAAMASDPAVLSVHHVHVWSLDGVRSALSGHLVLRDTPLSEASAVVERVGDALRHRFGIAHTTLQIETGPCSADDCGREAASPSSVGAYHR